MTELERARDRLLVAIGYALASESDDNALADALNKASEALDVASARQRDRDANAVRRAVGEEDCDDLPIPEDDCDACKGTGMRAPDRICGACEGTGITKQKD
jgi:hypothetical protein